MATLELLLEAEKRGILPEDKKTLLTEARNRGIISDKPVFEFEAIETPPLREMPEEPPERPSKIEFGIQGAGKQLATMLGLPFEAVNFALERGGVNTLLRKLGFPAAKPGELTALARKPFEREKPETFFERTAERTGEEIGAFFIPTAGVIGLSQKTYKASKGIIGAFVRILKDIGKQNPNKLLAIEAGLAASGGVGAALAKEAFPDSATAEIAGSLIGSLSPTVALKTIQWVKKIPDLLPPVSEKRVAERVGAELERAIKPEVGSRFDVGLEEAEALRKEIPGFKPTTAQATGEPGLIAKERAFIREEPRATTTFLEQQAESQQAIRAKLDELIETGELSELDVKDILKSRQRKLEIGLEKRKTRAERKVKEAELGIAETELGVEEARKAVSKRIESLETGLETRISRAKEKVESKIEDLKGKITVDDEGRILKDELDKEIIKFKQESDVNFSKLDTENKVELSFENVKETARELKTLKLKAEDPKDTPEIIEELLKKKTVKVEGKKQEVDVFGDVENFNEVRALRSRILSDIRNELASADPRRNKVRKLNTLLKSVQDSLDQLGKSKTEPELAKLYNIANKAFKEGVQRLREGITGQILRRGAKGEELKIGISEIAGKFFTKGAKSKEAIEAFKSSLVGKQPAQEALESFATRKLLDETLNPLTGKISASKLAVFLRNYKEPLKAFPELRNKIDTTLKAQKQLDLFEIKTKDIAKQVRKGEITTREAQRLGFSEKQLFDVEKTFDIAKDRYKEVTTGTIAKGISKTLNDSDKSVAGKFLGADPSMAMRDVLNSKTPSKDMAKLLQLTRKDLRAKRGLRILFQEELLRRGETLNIAPDGIPFLSHNYVKDFLTKHDGVIKQLYSSKEIFDLKRIQRALELNNRSLKAPLPQGSDTAQNINLAQNVNALTARLFALQRKVVSKSFLIAERVVRKLAKQRDLQSKENIRALMENALFNPEIAETLIMLSRNVPNEIITKRLRSHLISLGIKPLEQEKTTAKLEDFPGVKNKLTKVRDNLR